MAKTVINIKADKDIKEKAQKVAKNLGMPLSTIINAYLRQLVRTKEVHFFIEGTLRPGVRKELDRIDKDIKEGKNLSPTFTDVEKAIRYLNSR